jgi:hypothetical protein
MTGVTRREALTVGAGAALAIVGAAGLTSIATSAVTLVRGLIDGRHDRLFDL